MEKVLLHTCCAPCSGAIIEWMMQNGYTPTIYYCNPNIYPFEEYMIRKEECSRYARSLGLEIVDADYDHAAWQCCIAGLEGEPERGKRVPHGAPSVARRGAKGQSRARLLTHGICPQSGYGVRISISSPETG